MKTEENDTEAELAAWELLREARLELNAARAEIERLDTVGIHSCHKDCQRLPCVLRRERDEARAEIEAIMETLKSPIEVELDMIRGKIAIPDRSELEYITQLKAVTEQRDEALSDLEFRRDLYRLQTKTLDDVCEQRDRLAEALRELLTTGDNGYGTPTDKAWEMAEQALAAVEGGSDE